VNEKSSECPDLSLLDATEWAYIAGFFDGEGCVQLRFNGYRGRRFVSRSPRPYLELSLGQTKEDALYWMQEMIGGRVHFTDAKKRPRRKDGGLCRPFWVWRVSGAQALGIMKEMLPHLRVKVDEVELGIAFQEKVGRPHRRLTDSELSEFYKMADELKLIRECNV